MDELTFLKQIVEVLEYQSKPSVVNQGQCLDGYSALANYNAIAADIKDFLNGHQSTNFK
jgi:hypothetical protein